MYKRQLLILLFSFGLQFATLCKCQNLQQGYPKKYFKNLFFLLATTALFTQYIYLVGKEIHHPPSNLSDALFLFSNTLLLWIIITLITSYLKRTRRHVIELKSELRFDTLTHALSRRAILLHCELELARSQRNLQPISILAIDLDHLKQLNDTYGHPVGDEVLARCVQNCKQLLREIDLMGRIGGDEFIILLPNTSFDAAQEIADRIKEEMQNLHTNLSTPISLPITLSIGIATYSSRDTPIQAPAEDTQTLLKKLIEVSDTDLYNTKKFNHSRSSWHASNDRILKMG